MALIKCEECKKEISNKSSQCIHCGFPLKVNELDNVLDDEKFKNNLVCSVKINGNETWTPTSPYLKWILFIIIGLLFILTILSYENLGQAFLISSVLLGISVVCLALINILRPKYWKDKKKNKVINEYFKKRFHIINTFDYSKHEKIDEFNEKIDNKFMDNDEVMFNIYMKAFNKEADAIGYNEIKKNEINFILIKYK